MEQSLTHIKFMQQALSLAIKGKGHVSPNPCVGCVIVKNGRVVGKGYHEFYGGPHAEIRALEDAGTKAARGATAYLTLEPCTHWGKTPPCAPEIIRSGLKKVYIAMLDPNPKVSGNGVRAMRKAGIEVTVGLEQAAAKAMNRAFITWITKRRPYVILKLAMSLDGKIATHTGDSKWISAPASRRLVYRLRAESDAVLVGANTEIADNPYLTAHGAGRNPIRMVIDPSLRTPQTLRIYNDNVAPTWVVTSPKSSTSTAAKLMNKGVKILRESLKNGQINMSNLLRTLSKDNVSQLLVEGGGNTSWSFINSNLVDEVIVFIAPVIIGGQKAITPVEGRGFDKVRQSLRIKDMSVTRFGADILIRAFPGKA